MVVTWPSVPMKSIPAKPTTCEPDLGHQVAAALGTGQLAQEQAERPAPGLGLALDAQDGAQVPAAHGREHARRIAAAWPVGRRHGGHPPSRVDQLISASGLRRYSGVSSHGLTNCSRSAWAWASITSDEAVG